MHLHPPGARFTGMAQVHDLGLGLEQHRAARAARAPAQINVLDVQEITLVETA